MKKLMLKKSLFSGGLMLLAALLTTTSCKEVLGSLDNPVSSYLTVNVADVTIPTGDTFQLKTETINSDNPVASKQPNELGIYDMSGNVWEWTIDKDGDDKAYCGGGAFTSESDYCKVTSTWADDLTQGFNNAGFRLVLK